MVFAEMHKTQLLSAQPLIGEIYKNRVTWTKRLMKIY